MVLQNIINKCSKSLDIHDINDIANTLIKFINSYKCTEDMKKALTNRFGLLTFKTIQETQDLLKRNVGSTKISTDQLANNAGLAIQLTMEHDKPYSYVALEYTNNHLKDLFILKRSNIKELAQTMLSTRDHNIYNNQKKTTNRKIQKLIHKSLSHQISKDKIIQLTFKQLFFDLHKLDKRIAKTSATPFNRYKTLIGNIEMLQSVMKSNDQQWTSIKSYKIFSKHHHLVDRSTKITISKDHIQKVLLQQLYQETHYFDTSSDDNAKLASNNDIEYIWDLLDDIDVIKSAYESKDKVWVKDFITSTSKVIEYAPLDAYKKHAYKYRIDEYGQPHFDQEYMMINFSNEIFKY